MAIRNLRRQATPPLNAPGTPDVAPIYVDSDDNKVLINPLGSGTTYRELATVGAATSLTAARALTSADANKTLVLNILAGGTFTLPAATGTGNKYKIIVGTTLTSGSLVVAVPNATDFFRGYALLANDTDGSASIFETANTGTVATESDTYTFNRTTMGIGTIGDWIEVEDIATAVWSAKVYAQASGAEASGWSVAV